MLPRLLLVPVNGEPSFGLPWQGTGAHRASCSDQRIK
jgi:hypothetical protein